MIVITGFPRTGTTILFRSYVAAGYNPGEYLTGRPVPSEDRGFYTLNWQIGLYLGLGAKWKEDKRYPVFFDSVGRDLESVERETLERYWSDLLKEGIEVIKDPGSGPLIKYWLEVDGFRDSRIIQCKRNPKEAAKSLVRLKSGWYREDMRFKFTVQDALEWYEFHQGELDRIDKSGLDWHVVQLEDLIENTDKYEKELGIDLSLVDRNKVWAS